jgi:hypothetical protein
VEKVRPLDWIAQSYLQKQLMSTPPIDLRHTALVFIDLRDGRLREENRHRHV